MAYSSCEIGAAHLNSVLLRSICALRLAISLILPIAF